MARYNYEELRAAATAPNATQEQINALGEWMEQYGMNDWNGEYYDIGNGLNLYPVYTEPNENDQSFIDHYEIR